MIRKILVVGFITRLLFSLLPNFAVDFGGWIAWGERLIELGPGSFYSPEVWTNYLPGYLYVLWFLAAVGNFFQIPVNSVSYEIILKLPANLADLAIGFLIFKILKNYTNQKTATLAASLYIFNPVTIFNSAVWGQIDSVFTFFLLLATYLLLELKRPTAATLAIFASFIIKPQALALFPVFFAKLFQVTSLRKTVITIIFGLIFIFAISLPFFAKNPITGLPEMFFQMSADYQYTSLFAYNLWWLFGGWQNDSVSTFGLTSQSWGLGFWVLSQILIIFWFSKNNKPENFFLAASISLLSFFLLPTRVHERYLFPFFAFGAISASIFGRIFWGIWAVLTIIHFLNLYFVYTYYNPNFLKIEVLSNLISYISPILAGITLLVFGFLFASFLNQKWLKAKKS